MRILYGVQSTGNGHITRARAMAKALADQGLAVDYLFSGRPADQFFDMEIFGSYRLCEGFTLAIENGRLSALGTMRRAAPRRFLRQVRELDLEPYDLVVTDFEPVTAWAARLRGKPTIGIGHQYAFHYPIPRPRGHYHQRLLMRWMAPAQIMLGLHWHHFDAPLLPPIAPIAEPAADRDPGLIIVYLPFEAPATIQALATAFPDSRFAVYHPDANPGLASPPHIRWHRPNRPGFLAELTRCGGVICNAGFELASEALQLGVKLLVKPVRGQSEQQANALALERLRLGRATTQLDPAVVREWLETGPAVRVRFPNVAAAVARWIAEGHDPDIQPLSAALWRATRLPATAPSLDPTVDQLVQEP
jgi:uncharacterized protein (TIGR00661 family)